MTSPSDNLTADWITVTEVAEILRVSKMSVHRILDRDEIPHVRVGRQIRMKRDDVESWLQSGGSAMETEQQDGE